MEMFIQPVKLHNAGKNIVIIIILKICYNLNDWKSKKKRGGTVSEMWKLQTVEFYPATLFCCLAGYMIPF